MHAKNLAKNLIVGTLFTSLIAIGYTSPGATQNIPVQNTPAQSTARQVDRRFNISFEPRGCQRTSSSRVTCEVLVTNFTDSHRQISFGADYQAYQTRLVDSEGNVYSANSLQLNQLQRGTQRVLIELAPGIPTRLSYNFRVPSRINELLVIDLGYQVIGRIDTTARITLPNIGAITSNNAQRKFVK
ncbi:hypothetical protein NIES4071_89080 [Calothrix sp. NIES-4071]|nr:hypothetical protein NIES4071_89080 [Calothrix sp. NIES-4071]BAZ63175.1 hypothetical protein NIES4105_89010 [Calothrix sp. NIES-4105]